MDFLLIIFLTLLNGVFATSELALASSRKARLNIMAQDGDKGAQAALKLLDNPTQFLSSVQVGITLIGMLNGIIGEAAFSGALTAWLQSFNMPERIAAISATAIVVIGITFITIVFGELVPKRIGQLYPESVARWVSPPMTWLALIAKPFVALLSMSTHAVLKLMRIDNSAERGVTQDEITASLEEGRDAGVIEHQEHQMVKNVFQLDDRPLTSLMVPYSDIEWLEARHTVAQGLRQAANGERGAHSWYPVCRNSLDNVVGVISVARLLELGADEESSIESHAIAATYLPETLTGMELLKQFRSQSVRMILVVDEYGVVQGLMTPHDLLEAITGELQSGEVAEDVWATQREDGSWLLDGLMPISELKARLEIKELPQDGRGIYNTLAGLLMAESGNLPQLTDRIECAGWLFEVVDIDGKRIDKLLATRLIDSK